MLRTTLLFATFTLTVLGTGSSTQPIVQLSSQANATAYHAVPVNAEHAEWRSERVIVTAYVVNPRERGRCTVDAQPTATGTVAAPHTAAVDPRAFPYGTQFRIPGYGTATALDTGAAMRSDHEHGRLEHLDVAMLSCTAAMHWGVRALTVAYRRPK